MGLFIILNPDDVTPAGAWSAVEVSLRDHKKDMDKFKEAIKSFLIKVLIKTISNIQFKNMKFNPN